MSVGFRDDLRQGLHLHVVSVVPDPYKLMSEVKRVCKKGGNVSS